MDKVEVILKSLDANGIGNPKRINDDIFSLYPPPSVFHSDSEYFSYTSRVENFLRELQNANLLKFHFDGFWGVKSHGHYNLFDDCNIIATITYEGSRSLERNPITHQTNFSATFNAPFSGIFNQGDSREINQITSQESSDSKELTKKTLEDFPKTQWYRRWNFILTAIAIIISVIVFLLSRE